MTMLTCVISGTFDPPATHFANWMSGSETNGGNTDEKDCVVLVARARTSLGWKAVNCSEKHYVVCKVAPTGIFDMLYVMQL